MFSERLKEIRKSHNLTQLKLGELVGINKNTISKYENGSAEPCVSVIKAISEKLNVSSDYLLGLSDKIRSTNAEEFTLPDDFPGSQHTELYHYALYLRDFNNTQDGQKRLLVLYDKLSAQKRQMLIDLAEGLLK